MPGEANYFAGDEELERQVEQETIEDELADSKNTSVARSLEEENSETSRLEAEELDTESRTRNEVVVVDRVQPKIEEGSALYDQDLDDLIREDVGEIPENFNLMPNTDEDSAVYHGRAGTVYVTVDEEGWEVIYSVDDSLTFEGETPAIRGGNLSLFARIMSKEVEGESSNTYSVRLSPDETQDLENAIYDIAEADEILAEYSHFRESDQITLHQEAEDRDL